MMKQFRIGTTDLLLVGASDDDPYLAQLEVQSFPKFEALCRGLLPEANAVALDVGANIGVTAAVLSRCLPQGVVYAFEPGKSVYAALVRNVEQNRLPNVRPWNAAVSNAPGTVKFSEHFAYGHITTNPNAPTIPAITIDGFVEEHSLARVDFIKIDVEGYEKAVLEGATRTIARHSPIVLMEFNCWCLTAHSRINPLDFAEWIFREFRFVHVVDSKTPHLHLRRLTAADATAFVHDNMVTGTCVDDLLLTNDERHLPLIDLLNKRPEKSIVSSPPPAPTHRFRRAVSFIRRLTKRPV
jgi:FkbM family methyltransferase